jgi:molecular chaperone DnaJ
VKRDFYRILGVSRKVGDREVRRAYLKLARKYHPDVNPGDRSVAILFREIQEAYHVLVNPAARKLYDRKGEVPPAGGGRKERSRQAASADVRGWDRIVRDVFHGEEPDTAEAGATRGESLHQVLEVSFAESLKGAKKQIVYQREVVCAGCGGNRFAPGSRRSECGDCGGSGLVRIRRGPYLVNKICPRCFGGGEVSPLLCADCAGKGRRLVTERKTVQVPVGSDSGTIIEVAGGGQPGKRGGANGSLLVTLRVQAHPAIERRGYNLYSTVPIALSEAALGGTILVATAERKVSLKIPPGTQGGQQFRLRGRGVPLPAGSKRGDFYVVVRVEIPAATEREARGLFHQLEKMFPGNPRVGS